MIGDTMFKQSEFNKEYYKAGDVAKYLGVSVRTVQGYDKRGILPKSKLYGFDLVIVDRFFPSTQICSVCGEKTGPKGQNQLDIREWTCSNCGAFHNRDLNAAVNILNKGLNAVGHTVEACGERVRLSEGSPLASAEAKQCSAKQESR